MHLPLQSTNGDTKEIKKKKRVIIIRMILISIFSVLFDLFLVSTKKKTKNPTATSVDRRCLFYSASFASLLIKPILFGLHKAYFLLIAANRFHPQSLDGEQGY